MGHTMAVPGIMGSLGLGSAGAQSIQRFLNMAMDQDKVLVLIFLDGGNDGLNTVIPLDRLSALNAVRPHVMLRDQDMIELPGTNLAFHPAMDGLASLFSEDRLGIIQNVGYPEQNFSHFRSSDIWMSGSDADEVINSGWMGRFLNDTYPGYPDEFPNAEMTDPLAVEIGYGSSMLFQGPNSLMSMVLSNPESFYELLDERVEDVPDTLAGNKLEFVRLVAKQSQLYGQVVQEAAQAAGNQLEYPDTDLANQLKIVSRLISGGLKTPIYMVRIGGFDTHEGQVEEDHTTGMHAELLAEVNGGIMAFMQDLEHLGLDDKVLGMTFSEFGRRIISNASNGTDHGAAAPLFVFGNGVRGGVIGSNPVIDSSMNYEDNLPLEYDFRQVYASVLEQWFGVGSSGLNAVLYKDFDTLPIIGKSPVTGITGSANKSLHVYPNPLNGQATIEFTSNNTIAEVELVDVNGRLVERIYRGSSISNHVKFHWNTTNLTPGRYFVIVRQKGNDQVLSVVK